MTEFTFDFYLIDITKACQTKSTESKRDDRPVSIRTKDEHGIKKFN